MAFLSVPQEDAMPLHILITLLAVVIALAAITVAGFLFLTGGAMTPPMTILAVTAVVTLLASIIVRRYGGNRD
jgi:hypothetical protein